MATTARGLTFEELELIPEEHEGDRQELIDGELVVTPVPIIKHQIVNMNLIRVLDRHVNTAGLGMVFTPPTGIRFSPHNLLIPDISVVAQDRLHILGIKTIDGAPDLVVEFLSPGTRRRDLATKREVYARFGVREYWIVDAETRSVLVLALADDRYEAVAPGDDGAVASRVLPGLKLALPDVFTGVAEER